MVNTALLTARKLPQAAFRLGRSTAHRNICAVNNQFISYIEINFSVYIHYVIRQAIHSFCMHLAYNNCECPIGRFDVRRNLEKKSFVDYFRFFLLCVHRN